MRIHARLFAVMMLLFCLVLLLCACNVGGTVDGIKDKVGSVKDDVKDKVDGVKDDIMDTVDGIKDKVSSLVATTTTAPPPATEAPPTPGMLYQPSADGQSYVVRGYAGKVKDLVIAEEYEGMPVTSIMQGAFGGKHTLSSIRIPDSITAIGKGAFSGCNGLIRAESGLLYVDRWVVGVSEFAGSVVLRDDIVGIVDGAFEGRAHLASITLNASIRRIGDEAFVGCKSLSKIILPEENPVYAVVGDALYTKDMTRLILYFGTGETFTVPASVTEIAPSAFRDRSSLVSVRFEAPEALSVLGDYAFAGCTSLASFTLPEGLERIGTGAFRGCTSLALFTFPEESACRAIGAEAFRGCTAFVEFSIPESITEIGANAFYECTGLLRLNFSVTSGWKIGVQNVNPAQIDTPAMAAAVMLGTYHSKTWTRVK